MIPIEARIGGAADAFCARTADSPFRRSRSTGFAPCEIRGGAGTRFDPGIVEALCAVVEAREDGGGGAATMQPVPAGA